MKIPRVSVIIAMTPHVSTFFNPLRPSRKSSVIVSQKSRAKTAGFMLPGKICERLSPSPIRYAIRAA